MIYICLVYVHAGFWDLISKIYALDTYCVLNIVV
jgi:hypothetical protein